MILNHLLTFEEARWSSSPRLMLQAYSSGQTQMLVFRLPDQSPSHCTKDPRIHNLCYTWLKFYDMTELKKKLQWNQCTISCCSTTRGTPGKCKCESLGKIYPILTSKNLALRAHEVSEYPCVVFNTTSGALLSSRWLVTKQARKLEADDCPLTGCLAYWS